MAGKAIEARIYRMHGRVQGVGFRYFVQRTAERLGVAGWVLNRVDGSVEACGEADEKTLADFESALRRGPSLSRVDRLEVAPAEPSGVKGFRVRY